MQLVLPMSLFKLLHQSNHAVGGRDEVF